MALSAVLCGALLALVLETPLEGKSRARKETNRGGSAGKGAGLQLVPDYLVSKADGAYFQLQNMTVQVAFANLTDAPKMTLNVLCRLDPERMPLEYDRVARVRSVKFNNGWKPAPEEFLSMREHQSRSKVRESNNTFYFQIQLPLPARAANAIERLEGTLTVYDDDSPRDTAFLSFTDPEDARGTAQAGPFRLTLKEITEEEEEGGKTAVIEGLKNDAFRGALNHLYEWLLVLQNGKKISAAGQSAGQSRARATFRPYFEVPGKVGAIKGVLVSWSKETSEREIPFVFEEIPLP